MRVASRNIYFKAFLFYITEKKRFFLQYILLCYFLIFVINIFLTSDGNQQAMRLPAGER